MTKMCATFPSPFPPCPCGSTNSNIFAVCSQHICCPTLKGSGPRVGHCHLGKAPPPFLPPSLPPGSQLSWNLKMCCRDWLQGLWVQLLPRLSCGSQACRGISRCPNQIFSGPLARASLYLTKVVSALIPMAILLPPSQTARPRPSLHRDGHAREGLVSYHSMQNNPPP